MRNEITYALSKLERSWIRLNDGVQNTCDQLDEDGVIKRFEFTFEVFWKTLKVFLRAKGLETKTPRDTLKEAFKLEWLDDESLFLNMLDDRNRTSHIYDEDESRKIYERISADYLSAIGGVLHKLQNVAKDEASLF
jgi:nucleotidyltransferase substrate binding protein (TIGR01987 family)